MPAIKCYFSEKALAELEARAASRGLSSVQELIRAELFAPVEGKLSVDMVVERIRKQKPKGTFFLADLFEVSEWLGYSPASRGVIGRKVYEAVQAGRYPDISYAGILKRRATYQFHGGEE